MNLEDENANERYMENLEKGEGLGLSAVDAVVNVPKVPKESVGFKLFRSSTAVNMDYDMARITIDLPINKARELLKELKAH